MSSLRCGIIGMPNVGKSTLFNALTKQQAQASNFPFTTIEPNMGVVTVPDERLQKLTELSQSQKTVPTTIEFVDIAGLVEGAHSGEGLGNKFLSHIREVDAIVHVVRFFEDGNVLHVANRVNPLQDAEIIETELALADLDTVDPTSLKLRGAQESLTEEKLRRAVRERVHVQLSSGKPARELIFTKEEMPYVNEMNLLTMRPVLYVANVSESQMKNIDVVLQEFKVKHSPILALSVKIEQELIELSEEERQVFLSEYGLSDTGLHHLIQESYTLLNLITFFTTGEKESRAWTVKKGSTAPQAAGKIHSDFERGFIRAETVAYADLMSTGSYAAARSKGKVRDEGKEYIVKDGDVFIFKFSV